MSITLIECGYYRKFVEFSFIMICVNIGENSRSLFGYWKIGSDIHIDLLFTHIKQ